MFKLNGKKISLDQDLTIGDGDTAITYPAASLRNADLRAALGIVEVPDTVRPDDRYYWISEDAETGTMTAVPKDLDGLRATAITAIKARRQTALDTYPKSSGVSEIYAENLRAAQAVKSDAGETTIMRDGSTATAYLAYMAEGMGVTVAAFADYVIGENSVAAVKVREIEAEYVRLVYTHIPACTFAQVQTVAADFATFCAARMA